MSLAPWRTGIVRSIIDETPNTKRYVVEVPELDVFDFVPGQFVTLNLPIHEKPNKCWRSYSIASWPNGTNTFELVIVLLEGGLGTTYLFNQVQVGNTLSYRGAQGVFTLPSAFDVPTYFICTGTGIAPFRSMVQYIALHNIPHAPIHLVYGCRTQADLLYYNELVALHHNLPNYTYTPTLSRANWAGATGYVHSIYEQHCKASNYAPAQFYLCGWKAMIDDAKQKITAMGYDKKCIHVEVYG